MINSYLTDTVDLVRRVVDAWGSSTSATVVDVAARVEDKNRIVRDKDGKEVAANIHVMLDPGAVVDYQTFIKIKSRCGQVAELPLKEWPVKSLSKTHMFGQSAWEVWL